MFFYWFFYWVCFDDLGDKWVVNREIWLDCMPLYRTSKLTCHLGKGNPTWGSLSFSFFLFWPQLISLERVLKDNRGSCMKNKINNERWEFEEKQGVSLSSTWNKSFPWWEIDFCFFLTVCCSSHGPRRWLQNGSMPRIKVEVEIIRQIMVFMKVNIKHLASFFSSNIKVPL